MYSKFSVLVFTILFSFFAQAAVSNSNNLEVLSGDTLVINGPIYVTYNSDLKSEDYPIIEFVNGPNYFYGNKE